MLRADTETHSPRDSRAEEVAAQHKNMQRRRALAAVICFCGATSTAALAAPRRRCKSAKPDAARRCEPATPEDAPSALRRAQLAAAAAAALPAKPASAAPPAPEVATDRKGVPISKATWEAAHTPGAADLVAGLGGEPTLLLSGENGALEPFALQAECTHLGCLVGPWNPLSQRFVCPCHGSEYKRDGSVARGPAPKPLKLAKVGTDDKGQVVLEKWTEQDFRENV